MKIQGIGQTPPQLSIAAAQSPDHGRGTKGPHGAAQRSGTAAAAADTQVASAPTTETVGENSRSAKVPGVIRLLQAGHFKGVADVRLRIVHRERIAALEQQAVAEQTPQKIADIDAAVREQVQSLLDGGELSDEQRSAVESLLSTFTDTLAGLTGMSAAEQPDATEQPATATNEAAAPDVAATDADVAPVDAAQVELDEITAPTDAARAAPVAEEQDGNALLEPVAIDEPEPEPASLVDQIRAAYAELVASLQDLLAPSQTDAADGLAQTDVNAASDDGDATDADLSISAEDETATEPVASEPASGDDAAMQTPTSSETAEPAAPEPQTLDFASFFQSLNDAFNAALQSFSDFLASPGVLPPLSPDPGHGAAYAKFLAIYESLHSVDETAPVANTLDAVA